MPQQFIKVAKVDDIPPGTAKVFDFGYPRIAVCNLEGEFFAIEDECTHDGGSLDQGQLIGNTIECPRHGAKFDIRTGMAVELPAEDPVVIYPVKIDGNDIMVGI